MRVLPSGSTALLVELDDLAEVLALYATLADDPPAGVVDLVPAARTLLLVTDPAITSLSSVEAAVRSARPRPDSRDRGGPVDIPVTYDGEDLAEAAQLLGCAVDELVRRHTSAEWTVAFCGFVPGSATSPRPGGRRSLAARRRAPRCRPVRWGWRASSAVSTPGSPPAGGS